MAKQVIPLDIEIIFKEVIVNAEVYKVGMKRNGMYLEIRLAGSVEPASFFF